MKLPLRLASLVLALFATGCASGTVRVTLDPPLDAQALADSEPMQARIGLGAIRDSREERSRVGGGSPLSIQSRKVVVEGGPLTAVLRRDLDTCFRDTGFELIPVEDLPIEERQGLSVVVDVDVRTFRVGHGGSTLGYEVTSEVEIAVRARTADGRRERWSKIFTKRDARESAILTDGLFANSLNAAYGAVIRDMHRTLLELPIRKHLQ